MVCAYWFCWLRCTSPCVPFDFAGLRTEKSHRRCSGCCICLNMEIIFMSPLFLAVTCSPSGHCAEEFLGALDDEEVFVVEGSGWRRRRESDSRVTCHPIHCKQLCGMDRRVMQAERPHHHHHQSRSHSCGSSYSFDNVVVFT